MKAKTNRSFQSVSLCASLVLAGLGVSQGAWAGIVAEARAGQDGEGALMHFELENDDQVRIGFPEQDGQNYLLIREGGLYMVMQQQGETQVLDMADFLRMASSFAGAAMPETGAENISEVVSLTETGRSDRVAGIEGDVYELVWRDSDGGERRDELVLSDNALAREFSDAWIALAESMASITANTEGSEGAEDLRSRLDEEDKGFLRFGDQFTLTALREERFPADYFELPGPVMDMSGLLNSAFQADSAPPGTGSETEAEQDEGGLFGNVFNRQRERVEERSQQRTEEEADKTVDKAVDSVFRGLFGG